ncbi:hypothetical protein Pla22_49790 [Rubripirellula amarantea]|uniref:Uncharacterized protein n=1 Tax=Rubripirellula amarantea TaxID=2527999 RepID=A0A5C5WGV9_9BACT|nr:hypothetical protein Pla22_49790 [Rubripirellula amarantea]
MGNRIGWLACENAGWLAWSELSNENHLQQAMLYIDLVNTATMDVKKPVFERA